MLDKTADRNLTALIGNFLRVNGYTGCKQIDNSTDHDIGDKAVSKTVRYRQVRVDLTAASSIAQ